MQHDAFLRLVADAGEERSPSGVLVALLATSWSLCEGMVVAGTVPGDERLKRFGAAAVLGPPDGTVWSVLIFAL